MYRTLSSSIQDSWLEFWDLRAMFSGLCHPQHKGRRCVCVCGCVCAHTHVLSHIWLFATPWTVTQQTPLSMEFSRQEYWSGLPFPTPGNLSDPGMKPISPALAGRFFITAPLAESKGRRNTHCIPSVSCTRAGWFLCAVSSILKRSMLSVIGVLILTSERWRHGLHGEAGSPNFSSFSK